MNFQCALGLNRERPTAAIGTEVFVGSGEGDQPEMFTRCDLVNFLPSAALPAELHDYSIPASQITSMVGKGDRQGSFCRVFVRKVFPTWFIHKSYIKAGL